MARAIKLTFPTMYPKQYEAIFSPKRYSLIEAGTKTGKTLGCSIWEASEAWEKGFPGEISWWVAPTYTQAKLGYLRMKALLPPGHFESTDTDMIIKLPNGAVIQCRSGEKPDNLFGEGVHRAVVDEASRLREEAWHALRTTLTQTRGPVRLIGNPKGRKNWFWRWCQLAKNGGDPNAAYFHLRSSDNPHISPEEIEEARRNLPPSVFEELYEGVAQEDGAGVFRNVRECATAILRGPVQGRQYVAGLDLARLQDFSVLFIMDAVTKEVVYVDRINELNWNLQVKRFSTALMLYNNAPVMMDVTGLGDVIFDNFSNEKVSVIPYKFSNESKTQLIEALSIAFERGKIKIPNDRQLIHELECFEYTLAASGRVQYSAPEGLHDDMVISLALTNLHAERSGFTEHKPVSMAQQILRNYGRDVQPSGVDHWVGVLAEKHKVRKRVSVGVEV